MIMFLLTGLLVSHVIGQDLDVPYVPTPYDVVRGMLDMAEVGEDDTIYDLGCGDGRIVITAIDEYGAKKGVGVDLDPQRIRESRQNAQEAGVTDKITFIQGDLFDVDFSNATVLTLYLLPEINKQLRPVIFEMLRPGTRVVSHDFDMGIWQPDMKTAIDNSDIFLWIVPANVSGEWQWAISDESGMKEYVMNIDQQFQKITGEITRNGTKLPVTDMDIRGDSIRVIVKDVSPNDLVTVLEGNYVRSLHVAQKPE